jgi:hypothetical protein
MYSATYPITEARQTTKGRRWTGLAMSGIAILFLLFDSLG